MLPLIMSVVCCFLCMLAPQPPLDGELIDPFFEGFKRTARIVVLVPQFTVVRPPERKSG